MSATDDRISKVIDELLERRLPPATICPSEVAKALAPQGWRPLMPQVRAVAITMARDGVIDIRQGGRTVAPGEFVRGPIRLGRPLIAAPRHPVTPDGRYFVVRERLWRMSNPHLPPDVRDALVKQLMDARRALRHKMPEAERRALRDAVDRAKRALGERGPVWWTDGEPDFNRKLARNTPYRDWFSLLTADSQNA